MGQGMGNAVLTRTYRHLLKKCVLYGQKIRIDCLRQ